MKREDKWGEDTSRSRKMGGVYFGEGKSGWWDRVQDTWNHMGVYLIC